MRGNPHHGTTGNVMELAQIGIYTYYFRFGSSLNDNFHTGACRCLGVWGRWKCNTFWGPSNITWLDILQGIPHGSYLSTITAPVETEKQQKIDEKLSGSSATRTTDNSNGQYKYSQCKVGVVISTAQTRLPIRLSADPASRFLGSSERSQSG